MYDRCWTRHCQEWELPTKTLTQMLFPQVYVLFLDLYILWPGALLALAGFWHRSRVSSCPPSPVGPRKACSSLTWSSHPWLHLGWSLAGGECLKRTKLGWHGSRCNHDEFGLMLFQQTIRVTGVTEQTAGAVPQRFQMHWHWISLRCCWWKGRKTF